MMWPDSVRIVCAGKNYKFVNRGGYAMKGFEDDITLYESHGMGIQDVYTAAKLLELAQDPAAPVAAERPVPDHRHPHPYTSRRRTQ